MAISLMMTMVSKMAISEFRLELCINFLIQSKKELVQALINLGSEVFECNESNLCQETRPLDLINHVDDQKINGLSFENFGMIIAIYSMNDKIRRSRFFEEIFLLAFIYINIVLGISVFALSNIKINFLERELN